MKEGNILFNDTLITFYLRLYGVRIWLRATRIAREETHCHHMGYSFRLAAMVILYASSHRQDSTYNASVTPVVEHWLEPEINPP